VLFRSLTIAATRSDAVVVALVPHTLAHTTMAGRHPGDRVNIECDVLARYTAHFLRTARESAATDGSLYAKLAGAGF
jgi:riboflavin synthase